MPTGDRLNRLNHTQRYTNSQMRSSKNMWLHGLYLGLYGFVKYLPFPFTNYLRYFVIKLFGPRIYATYIADGVQIWFPWNIEIGQSSSLNQQVIVDGFGGVQIGKHVRIAAFSTINTADHAFDDPDMLIREQGYVCAPVKIEDDVWIGTHVTINKGVTIGRGTVIGSGSVVTKDIPSYSVAVGNPCRVIRSRRGIE